MIGLLPPVAAFAMARAGALPCSCRQRIASVPGAGRGGRVIDACVGIWRDALFKDPAFLAYLDKVRPYLRDQEVRLLVPSACNPPIGGLSFAR